MIGQKRPIAPPVDGDEKLVDFSSVVQGNLEDLYFAAHDHTAVTSLPSANDGANGDIRLVEDTSVTPSVFYLYCKFSAGWKRVLLT